MCVLVLVIVQSGFLAQKPKQANAEVGIQYFVDEPIKIFSNYGNWHSSPTLKTTDVLGQALFAMGFENDNVRLDETGRKLPSKRK